jgi:hypothetical protein
MNLLLQTHDTIVYGFGFVSKDTIVRLGFGYKVPCMNFHCKQNVRPALVLLLKLGADYITLDAALVVSNNGNHK